MIYYMTEQICFNKSRAMDWLTLTSAPKAFSVPRSLLKLSFVSMKLILADGELYLGVSVIILINCNNCLMEIFANFYTISEFFLVVYFFIMAVNNGRAISKRNCFFNNSSFLCYGTDENVMKTSALFALS